MARIRVLPETTVNRIAAGEVIERPAAAVKELVENALDAGASRIAVTLAGGGIDRIEVSDDGIGMGTDDLALAVLRHATSKLADDQLIRIDTLGFRGEALPSIGAAARLEITSRPGDADHACQIRVEGGRVEPVVPAGGPAGTRVVVRDLFFATPARRKFLRQPRTEADHAEAAVQRLAMAAPGVAFRLEIEGRVSFDLPAQDRAARAAALLGPEAAAAMMPVRHVRGTLAIEGYACSPAITRATAVAQHLVVNGRPVADPTLKSAIRVAYRDVIAHGRYPVVALFLTIPAEELDVNVHPAKTEVRFRDGAGVRALVIGGIQRALAGQAAPQDETGDDTGDGAGAPRLPEHRPQLRLAYSRPSHGRSAYGRPSSAGIQALPLPGFPQGGLPGGGVAPRGVAEAALPIAATPAARTMPAAEPDPAHPLGAAVAQVLDTYVLAVAGDGSLVIVDQHAAHERLTHEAIRAQMTGDGVRAQPLLLPAVVDLPPSDAGRLADAADDLRRLGLDLEPFGPGAIMVRAMPAALGAAEPGPLLRDLADELAELGQATALEVRLDAVIARLACHGSIRAGRRLSQPEMDALLRQMEANPRAATCSHGRPTFLKLSRAEIERLFGRR